MPTRNETATQQTPLVMVVQWTGLLVGDDGRAYIPSEHPDRTVQVRGTFGGATLAFQGSNDPGASPAVWFTLTNQAATALSFTSAGGGKVIEATRWVRPLVTGGDGTTSLTVDLVARR